MGTKVVINMRRSGRPKSERISGVKGKQFIVTGHEFGLAIPINTAIAVTPRTGTLSVTSVSVGASAAADAVAGASFSAADGPPFPDMASGDEAGLPE